MATLCSSEDVSSQTDGTLGDNTQQDASAHNSLIIGLLYVCLCVYVCVLSIRPEEVLLISASF